MLKINNNNRVVLVFDVVLVLNIFDTFSSVSIVDFEQLNASCVFLLLKIIPRTSFMMILRSSF